MEIKIGDKVRVKKDLIVNKLYGDDIFVKEMEESKGKVLEVVGLVFNNKFTLKGFEWSFTTEMIEKVIDKKDEYFC
ncbi:MAG: hypothetical protein ACOC2W_03080, partial [bacterium]